MDSEIQSALQERRHQAVLENSLLYHEVGFCARNLASFSCDSAALRNVLKWVKSNSSTSFLNSPRCVSEEFRSFRILCLVVEI